MYEKSKSDRRGIFSLEEYSQMGNSEMERATNNQHKHRRWRICSIQQLLWSSWRSLLLLGSRTQTIAKVFQSGGNANPPVFSLGAVNGAQKFAKCAKFSPPFYLLFSLMHKRTWGVSLSSEWRSGKLPSHFIRLVQSCCVKIFLESTSKFSLKMFNSQPFNTHYGTIFHPDASERT